MATKYAHELSPQFPARLMLLISLKQLTNFATVAAFSPFPAAAAWQLLLTVCKNKKSTLRYKGTCRPQQRAHSSVQRRQLSAITTAPAVHSIMCTNQKFQQLSSVKEASAVHGIKCAIQWLQQLSSIKETSQLLYTISSGLCNDRSNFLQETSCLLYTVPSILFNDCSNFLQ